MGAKDGAGCPKGRVPGRALLLFAASVAACTFTQTSFAMPSRRQALLVGATGVAGAAAAAPASAFKDEDNRIAFFRNKVTQLNQAVDWYLFDVRPMIFPSNPVPVGICDDLGFNCPDRMLIQEATQNFVPNSEGRAMRVSLSPVERYVHNPMKMIATGSIFDPDTEEELQQDADKVVMNNMKLAKAAMDGDVELVRKSYVASLDSMNNFFQKVNRYTEVPEGSEGYLTPIPSNDKFQAVLASDRYWQRRQEKYVVKKKVDGTSKASKTVRFYAKSIYGDDAVSWDPRGDSGPF
mmetsp:Transcript_52735/g.123340  ORF Transcript_52735/g.123340 Transcript_52735/m.123340 type:complete len:293 (-) Transcript_52735:233-1111(-)